MTMTIAMLLAYAPFFVWMYKQARLDIQQAQKEKQAQKQ